MATVVPFFVIEIYCVVVILISESILLDKFIFRKMAQFDSSVKLCPSGPKKSRYGIQWEKCIICQSSSTELLISMRSQIKASLLNAMEARKDEVYSLVLQDISVLDCIRSEHFKVMCHRSCYKSYTSKHNCSFFKTESIAVESQQISVHPLVPSLEIQHNGQVTL